MISKSASDKSKYTESLAFTNSARTGWELIINSIISRYGKSNILLPSYIGITDREGSGIFDPVQNTKSDFDFYLLNDDLSINYEDLESQVKSNKFNILLIVHYFGICRNDLECIKSLCAKYELVLVEDCAHAFQLGSKKETLGINGDFSFYSVHKYFPVESGGIVKNISRKIDLIEATESQKMNSDVALQILKSDREQIAKKRKSNFKLYNELLRDCEGITNMYNLMQSEIPQSYPILVKNNQREHLYFYLMNKGLPTVALYYRLIDELKSDKYLMSLGVSKNILNLPVHQDIDGDDILTLTDEIKLFFAK